jgi:YVTN family beta-propeller protein
MIAVLLSALAGSISQPTPSSEALEETSPVICVSNERGGTVSFIDPRAGRLVETIPVGKRPRGIHASPDGATLYVAVSGVPIVGPTKLDAQGRPIEPAIDEKDIDHDADGIAVVDLRALKLLRKIPAGSDPEQFAVSADGKTLYVSNEDVGTASVVDAETGRVLDIVRVKPEPEGVGISPDGKWVFVTCETNGNVFRFEATPSSGTKRRVEELDIGGRPRSVVFSPDGSRAFVPSETTGQVFSLDLNAWRVDRTIKLPDGARPMGTALSPEGKRLYLTTGRGGTLCVLDTTDLSQTAAVPIGKRPWGIAVSADGARVYAADGPSDELVVIDAATLKPIERIKCGAGPWGVTVVPRQERKTVR